MKFFLEFFNPVSVWFLVFMLVSFLIGFFTAWLVRGAKIRRYALANKQMEDENKRFAALNTELQERETLALAEARRAKEEVEPLRETRRNLEGKVAHLELEIAGLNAELKDAKMTNIAESEQLEALKGSYQQMQGHLGIDTGGDIQSTIEDLRLQLAKSQSELDILRSTTSSEADSYLHHQLSICQSEKEQLSTELNNLKALSGNSENNTASPESIVEPETPEIDYYGTSEPTDDDTVNFLQYPPGDEFENAMALAKRAIEQEGFYTQVDHSKLEENPELVKQSLEEDLAIQLTPTNMLQHGFSTEPELENELDDKTRNELDEALAKARGMMPEVLLDEDDDLVEDAENIMPRVVSPAEDSKEGIENSDKPTQEQAVNLLAAMLGNRIPTAHPSVKDDLKDIVGIGPVIETKLHELGIFTFAQIAAFDDEIIDLVTIAIEFFPGRIEHDEWVKQANELM